MKNKPNVTIGLVIKNEEKYIKDCVKSILKLNYPEEKFELLIADGRSKDKTLEILKKYKQRANIRVFENEKEIISAGRNLIIEKSNFGLIAFTDGDCEVEPEWLNQLVENIYQKEQVACVGGPNIEFEDDPPLAKLFAEIQETFLGSGGSAQSYKIDKEREVESIPNCNALYKKKWLEKVGKYDEKFNVGEDADVNYRIKKQGGIFLYSPLATVKHHRRSTWFSFAKNNYKYGKAMAKLFKKYGEIIRWYAPFPTICIFAAIFLLLLGIFSIIPLIILLGLVVIYGLLLLAMTLILLIKKKKIHTLLTPIAYTIQIVSYGIGFFNGILKKFNFDGKQ